MTVFAGDDMTYDMRLNMAKKVFYEAEYIVIGAGAGLSSAAGLEYSGKRFTDNFEEFIKKYGMTDMYSSGFYPFSTEEEKWAYWAKHIFLNRYATDALPMYKDLYNLIKNKNYFVITTNVDAQFEKSGFQTDKIFAVQGDYGFNQCNKGCHNLLYNNEYLVKSMLAHTRDCKIPTGLVPKCPVCGGEMVVHLRCDNYFVQNNDWYNSQDNYIEFIRKTYNKKVVFLELGVGFNTPAIIRYPFEQMTYKNNNAIIIRVNKAFPKGVEENREKTISFTENMWSLIKNLR